MKLKNILKLSGAIAICLIAGAIGSLFNTSIKTWYASLDKPFFNPPNWIFAPVWTTLFVLMGISLYLVWSKKRKSNKPIYLFLVQLVLNVLWSFLFFYLQKPLYGFIEIIILWIFILLTILEFKKISKTAAYLMIPYICWVSFAAILNFTLMLLNW